MNFASSGRTTWKLKEEGREDWVRARSGLVLASFAALAAALYAWWAKSPARAGAAQPGRLARTW